MSPDKLLDTLHSIFIRLKYTDENGFGICVTCGNDVKHKYHNLQCGHYIPRGNTFYRWAEENTRPQCENCNCYLKGNLDKYREFLIQEYDIDFVEDMEFLSKQNFKFIKSDKLDLIKLRRKQCRDLLKDKSFQVTIP